MALTTRRFILRATAVSGLARAQRSEPVDIFQAAAAGDIARATQLADADPQVVRLRSADGRTPLHYATAAGQQAMVLFLNARGAELSAGPESPLIAAAEFPDHAIASQMSRFLLGNGSDPNARRHDGRPVIELARARGYDDIVEMLIHRGAKARSGQGANVERVHFDRRYLEDLHSRPIRRDDTEGLPWTAINQFVTLAHTDFPKVKQLYQDTPPLLNTRASWDELAVEAAAHTGHFEMAEGLAEKGAPVSTCTAVLLGQETLVRRALAADPLVIHECGPHDLPILSYTAYAREQHALAALLLGAGANVHAAAFGYTTLHFAAMKGYANLADVLISHGADTNATVKTKDGLLTPAAMAARANHPEILKVLQRK
jgi:ankyrin repeat protein